MPKMRFRKPLCDYADWSEEDRHLSIVKKYGRVPGTGSATDFLYSLNSTCPRCGGPRSKISDGVYKDCYILHEQAKCTAELIRRTIRQEFERMRVNGTSL